MNKILVIDNYDSFTYNLVHYLERVFGSRPDVFRNNEITLDQVGKYDRIVLSPGPGIPEEAGIILDVLKTHGSTKKILGVCLGHQAIGEAFGGSLFNLPNVYHGIASEVKIMVKNDPFYKGIPDTLMVGRYHSWAINKKDLPVDFEITCEDEDGMIMGIRHKKFDITGVQFHPESVLTEHGLKMIENWINM